MIKNKKVFPLAQYLKVLTMEWGRFHKGHWTVLFLAMKFEQMFKKRYQLLALHSVLKAFRNMVPDYFSYSVYLNAPSTLNVSYFVAKRNCFFSRVVDCCTYPIILTSMYLLAYSPLPIPACPTCCLRFCSSVCHIYSKAFYAPHTLIILCPCIIVCLISDFWIYKACRFFEVHI